MDTSKLYYCPLYVAPGPASNVRIGSFDMMPLHVRINLTWEAPVGEGGEAIVDYYLVSVTPPPLYHQENVTTLSLQVLLQYNQSYSAIISPVNCAGTEYYSISPVIWYSTCT
jgi:hypothetical protein